MIALFGKLKTACILTLLGPVVAFSRQAGNDAAQEQGAALKKWQDERFGMFVHWGVYSVPAGVHDGKPVRHLGEWIMHHGKIPKEDYRKYAEQFAAEHYDPAKWVNLAKEAGMEYMVVTAKHHDGFALYDSAASDWNSVEASAAKRDLMKPLVEECRKQGMPLGYHYSQALDWWHPGGGKYGSPWDPSQEGEFDAYLSTVAVPQIKELVANYGPVHCFFFDTPVEMNAVRAKAIEDALPASVLYNDRLFPGSRSSYRSYEGQLPREFFPHGNWELCISINDTWGYKRADQNWKSAESLKRILVETATRGGNMLLNVGPDASGEIPRPAVDVLRSIGSWMSKNGESIRGTRRSPYHPIPWNGGCTVRSSSGEQTLLYAHLYERPADGKLLLPGLGNTMISAELLGGGKGLHFARSGNSWQVELPPFPAGELAVVKVTLEGKPRIEKPSLTAGADGNLTLSAGGATLKGEELRVERQSDSLEQNIGFWMKQADTARWSIELPAAGSFATEWNMACDGESEGSVIAVMAGGTEVGRFVVPATGGWNTFRQISGPAITLPAGTVDLILVPLSKPGLGVMNLRGLKLSKTH